MIQSCGSWFLKFAISKNRIDSIRLNDGLVCLFHIVNSPIATIHPRVRALFAKSSWSFVNSSLYAVILIGRNRDFPENSSWKIIEILANFTEFNLNVRSKRFQMKPLWISAYHFYKILTSLYYNNDDQCTLNSTFQLPPIYHRPSQTTHYAFCLLQTRISLNTMSTFSIPSSQ